MFPTAITKCPEFAAQGIVNMSSIYGFKALAGVFSIATVGEAHGYCSIYGHFT